MSKTVFRVSLLFFLGLGLFKVSGEDTPQDNSTVNSQNQTIETEELDSEDSEKNDSSSQNQVPDDLLITKINVKGLKRTKNFYIQSRLKKFLNTTTGETDLHDIENILQTEGIFDDIHVNYGQPSGKEISVEISVKEKITFIPLPFAAYSSSGFMAGLMILDTNAFGMKDTFLFGGIYSPKAITGLATFSKPPSQNFIPGFTTFFSATKNSPEIYNLDNELVFSYESLVFNAGFSLDEKISEHNSLSLALRFKKLSADQKEGYEDLVESVTCFTTGLTWAYSTSDWNGCFLSSKKAKITTEFAITNLSGNQKYPENLSYAFLFQQPIVEKLRFYIESSGYLGRDNHISAYESQGIASVTILPGEFITDKIAGGNTGLELAWFKGKYGMLSFYGSYELVAAEEFGEKEIYLMQGATGGIRLYLSKIAFPALAMGLSYNVTKEYWQFSAAFGVTM